LTTSFIAQFVPAAAGESFELVDSLAKAESAPSAAVTLQVNYFNSAFSFLGQGLFTSIPLDGLADADNNAWLEICQSTSPAPPGTTQAFILINTLPQAGTSDIVVDDVALFAAESAGTTGVTESAEAAGVTGATGATGATGTSAATINFRAEKNIEQSYMSGSITQVACDDIIYNTGNGYSAETNTFTAPISGIYLFVAAVGFNRAGSGDDISLRINKNGRTISGTTFFDDSLSTAVIQVSTIINLVNGDQVTVSFFNGQNGTLTIGRQSFFSGSILP